MRSRIKVYSNKSKRRAQKKSLSNSNSLVECSNELELPRYYKVPTYGQVIWNGGGPFAWKEAKDRIKLELLKEGVGHEFVNEVGPLPDKDENGNYLPGPDTFKEPMPDRYIMVTQALEDMLEGNKKLHNAYLSLLEQYKLKDENNLSFKRMEVELEYLRNENSIMLRQYELEYYYNEALYSWEKKRERNHRQRTKFLEIIDRCLGDTAKSLIREYLLAGQCNIAWRKLCEEYERQF